MDCQPTIIYYDDGGAIDELQSRYTSAASSAAALDLYRHACGDISHSRRYFDFTDGLASSSQNMMRMVRQIMRDIEDPNIQGIVITQLSHTINRAARFLDMCISSEKPVIFVQIDSPPLTGVSGVFDQFSKAIGLANNPEARGRGVMILADDDICAACPPSEANRTKFSCTPGLLATYHESLPLFFYPAEQPNHQ